MARVAFIMDRLLRWFGLHGQSTLPLILGGSIVGGCAVPGTMACRGIKDQKARLVTILVMPLTNCMAKGAFYVLMVSVFFEEHAGTVIFGLSLFLFIVCLLAAKFLSRFVVRGKAAPFILELSTYHVPTLGGVARRAVERTWIFLRKVFTIIVAVAVIVWLAISFPGLDETQEARYNHEREKAMAKFSAVMGPINSYGFSLADEPELLAFGRFLDEYKKARLQAQLEEAKDLASLDRKFRQENPGFFEAIARSERIEGEKEFQAYALRYGKEKERIKRQTNITLYRALFRENPEFFKLAAKGKVVIEEEKMASFESYLALYHEQFKGYLARYRTASGKQRERLKHAFYQEFRDLNPEFFMIVRTGQVRIKGDCIEDRAARQASRAYGELARRMRTLRRLRREERIRGSLAGAAGRGLEPVSKLAGFDWRVNIGLISAFAAKENLVATLGTLYSVEGEVEESRSRLATSLKQSGTGMTPLHALAIMVFIALFPPCIPTLIMIKVEANSTKWMLLAASYPILLGFVVAVAVFQLGGLLGLFGG